MQHIFEWEVQVADAHGEVVHCDHCESYGEAVESLAAIAATLPDGFQAEIVLVREDQSAESRRLAYASITQDGLLPLCFTGEDGLPAGDVPREFLDEVSL